MSFASGIAGYAKRTKLSIDDAVVSINTKAAINIIKKTPVDTGRARGNWFASIGELHSGISENISGIDSTKEAIGIAKESSGKVFYLTNNLPYIQKLEYGYSKQAPLGMVRLTIEDIQTELKKFSTSR